MKQEQFGYKVKHHLSGAMLTVQVPTSDLIQLLKYMLDNDIIGIPVFLFPVRAIPEERLTAAYRVIEKREDRIHARKLKEA